jgi:hypothetical protein
MLYHNDQWDVSERLGMEAAGDGLAKMILSVSPPFTIAVAGKWGSGKTSLMQRAFVTLGGEPISKAVPLGELRSIQGERVYDSNLCARKLERRTALAWSEAFCQGLESSLCVWYSPWQHQGADNPLVPLLLEVKQQYLLRAKTSLTDKAKEKARNGVLAGFTLLERVVDGALMITGKVQQPFLTGTTEAIRNVWNNGDEGLSQLSDGQRFHLQFEDAIETVLKSLNADAEDLAPNARLVVFIDDLDRCEESAVIQLLEAIKLYLGTPRCVFVLGMDTIAVLEALRSHWPTRSEDHNREYLEKLFQATIRVPAPRKTSAYHLVEQQLNEHHIPNAAIWAIQLVDLIEPNPRKLKNFTNSLCAVWSMHRLIATREDDQTIRRLILFQYLSLYHPAVWRILERQPWALQILRAVLMGNTQEALRADQRMMESYFSRSFAHILRHNSNDPSKDEKHRGVEMEKAVELFLERIDRKRSDEVFARLAQATFTNEDAVDECFLSIVAAQANGANP